MSKENEFFISNFVKYLKGLHFTVKKFYVIKLSYFAELHKNLKYVIKSVVFSYDFL